MAVWKESLPGWLGPLTWEWVVEALAWPAPLPQPGAVVLNQRMGLGWQSLAHGEMLVLCPPMPS